MALKKLRRRGEGPEAPAGTPARRAAALDKRYIANVAIAGTAGASSEIFNPGTGLSIHGGVQVGWD